MGSSDRPLSELIRALNDANALSDQAARDKAVQAVRAAAPPGPRRVFVGKNPDKSATVSLADATGKPRLTLRVDADGNVDSAPADALTALAVRPPSLGRD